MKTFKLLLLTIAFGLAIYYTEAKAQTQFDYLGGLPVYADSTGCFYIDLNTYGTNTGENDVKIVHGSGEIYFEGIYADSAYMPGKSKHAYEVKKNWLDCDEDSNLFNKSRVYIISDISILSVGSHVLPFKYNGWYNYLVVRVESDKIFIRGWVLNMTEQQFECFTLND